VDSTTRAPKRFCDRAVILLAICNWPKSVRMSIRRVRNPARQAKSRQEMWRARASTGLVLASIRRRNRPLGWMHSPRRKSSLGQPKQSESPMSYRFITKSIHAYVIDYPFAIVLIAAPFVLKLGQSEPVAMWLSVVVGVAALLLPALTDHPTGLVRIIPYWLHLWVDRAVGLVFVIAPFAFKFAGLDAWYYWVLAAGVLLSTSVFNAPEKPVATRSGLDMRTAG